MRAAVEYLLCGLPVVSTPSIGGRERVLDPAWSKIVEPTPEAVAGAVAELIARPIDPTRIRLGTFEKLRPDRIRLLKLIAAIHESEGVSFPRQAPWERLFRIGTWPVALATDVLEGPAIADMSAS
jgi:glycosyltransferase involved in cell wall biosynthesis